MSGTPIAFFDVDETLLTVRSMFAFHEHFLQEVCRTDEEVRRGREPIARVRGAGFPRADANRAFYRIFTGYGADRVAEAGRRWFDVAVAGGGLFHADVLGALRVHRRRRRRVHRAGDRRRPVHRRGAAPDDRRGEGRRGSRAGRAQRRRPGRVPRPRRPPVRPGPAAGGGAPGRGRP